MRTKLMIALLASALAAPVAAKDDPSRGLESVNVPVVSRSDYMFDAAAPDGQLSPAERARLEAWFDGLSLGFGDRVSVEGNAAYAARRDVSQVLSRFGMLVSNNAPVVAGAVADGSVRVVVSRTRASMPTCPNWSVRAQPNHANRTMSNFGCAVNGNLAAMVADPSDLVFGRAALPGSDGFEGAKAIALYRSWELTAVREGQTRRPLLKGDVKTSEDK